MPDINNPKLVPFTYACKCEDEVLDIYVAEFTAEKTICPRHARAKWKASLYIN